LPWRAPKEEPAAQQPTKKKNAPRKDNNTNTMQPAAAAKGAPKKAAQRPKKQNNSQRPAAGGTEAPAKQLSQIELLRLKHGGAAHQAPRPEPAVLEQPTKRKKNRNKTKPVVAGVAPVQGVPNEAVKLEPAAKAEQPKQKEHTAKKHDQTPPAGGTAKKQLSSTELLVLTQGTGKATAQLQKKSMNEGMSEVEQELERLWSMANPTANEVAKGAPKRGAAQPQPPAQLDQAQGQPKKNKSKTKNKKHEAKKTPAAAAQEAPKEAPAPGPAGQAKQPKKKSTNQRPAAGGTEAPAKQLSQIDGGTKEAVQQTPQLEPAVLEQPTKKNKKSKKYKKNKRNMAKTARHRWRLKNQKQQEDPEAFEHALAALEAAFGVGAGTNGEGNGDGGSVGATGQPFGKEPFEVQVEAEGHWFEVSIGEQSDAKEAARALCATEGLDKVNVDDIAEGLFYARAQALEAEAREDQRLFAWAQDYAKDKDLVPLAVAPVVRSVTPALSLSSLLSVLSLTPPEFDNTCGLVCDARGLLAREGPRIWIGADGLPFDFDVPPLPVFADDGGGEGEGEGFLASI
jgi:hypothetical protein